jgi:DNA polymerase I
MKTQSRTSAVEYWLPCRTCQNPPIVCDRVIGSGTVALVLDYPTNLERAKGRLLQGDTGKLIRLTLESLGVDEQDVNVVSALNCKPPVAKPKLLRESMACCRARLLRELRAIDAKKVLCLGTIGYTALTSTDKIANMAKVHCRWVPVYGMWMIGTYSPTRVIMDPELYRDWIRAFNKFFTTNGREPWPRICTTTPTSIRKLQKEMEQIGGFTTDHQLSLDIETTGFSPIDDETVAVGFGSMANETDGNIVIIDYELLQDERTWWMIADQLEFGWTTLHNGKFDLKFIVWMFRKLGIEFRLGKLGDTMLLNYCLDERPWGKYGAHSLKNISRARYDAPDYDINVGEWIKKWNAASDSERITLARELHTYLTLDCYYTARLGRDLRSDVLAESETLLDFYDWLLIPASNALSAIELRGVKLDRQYLLKMGKKLTNDLEVSTAKLRSIAGDPEFNPGSTKQVHSLLYEHLGLPVTKGKRKGKVQEGPTSKAVIQLLRSRYPRHAGLFNEILNWRRIQKTRSTYVYGLLDRMDDDDRVRGDYLLHGTGTGRISSINPNLQNIPDESHIGFDIRAAFIPENDEWLFFEADYSQLELRVAAHLTSDKNLIQVYKDDGDLHQDALSAMFRKEAEDITHHERRLGKSAVFGAMYDRGPESLAYGAEMDYVVNELGGTAWTLNETRQFFNRFFARYPKLAQWQSKMRKLGYTDQRIETEFGRFRRFPFITHFDNGTVGRQSINMPIQSLASDITLDALVRVQARFDKLNRKHGRIVAHVVLTIHDELVCEGHKSVRKQVRKIIVEEMEQVPLDTVVPFKVKLTEGTNWSNCS